MYDWCIDVFLCKQKTSYEMRINDWSSDVCSSDRVAIRDDLAGRIDDLATDAADRSDDRSWRALSTLRVTMVRDVTARAGSLARAYSYRPAATDRKSTRLNSSH